MRNRKIVQYSSLSWTYLAAHTHTFNAHIPGECGLAPLLSSNFSYKPERSPGTGHKFLHPTSQNPINSRDLRSAVCIRIELGVKIRIKSRIDSFQL